MKTLHSDDKYTATLHKWLGKICAEHKV